MKNLARPLESIIKKTMNQSDQDTPAFSEQFTLSRKSYVDKLDFLNWFRYFYIIKDLLDLAPVSVLEIGAGDGFIRRIVAPEIAEYKVMDINGKLAPDYVQGLRQRNVELRNRFDCVLAADVLEHIEFCHLGHSLANIHSYLKPGGHFIVTIPHRRSYFLFMSPTYRPHVFAVPTGFLSLGSFYRRFIKRKIWIDPHHCWEIGDGHVKRMDVENAFQQAGLQIVTQRRLLYVDYWILRRFG